jgi:hypothetical protein
MVMSWTESSGKWLASARTMVQDVVPHDPWSQGCGTVTLVKTTASTYSEAFGDVATHSHARTLKPWTKYSEMEHNHESSKTYFGRRHVLLEIVGSTRLLPTLPQKFD